MTVAKKTTTRKPAARKPAAKAAPKRAAAPRKTAKIIRNLRGTVVNARLYSVTPKDPFRITLNPRGKQGDTATIPVGLIDDFTFTSGIGVLWEVITKAEANEVAYQSVGYLGRTDAPQIIRPEDNTVLTAKDWDGTGRRAPEDREKVETDRRDSRGHQVSERGEDVGTGMHTIDVPGSDTGLHALLAQGNKSLPPEADFSRTNVRIERVKG